MNITAASCVFPSGPGIALAGIALDVQMAMNREHPFYVDRSGSIVRGSFFPQPGTFDETRWVALAQASRRAWSMPYWRLAKIRPLHLAESN